MHAECLLERAVDVWQVRPVLRCYETVAFVREEGCNFGLCATLYLRMQNHSKEKDLNSSWSLSKR